MGSIYSLYSFFFLRLSFFASSKILRAALCSLVLYSVVDTFLEDKGEQSNQTGCPLSNGRNLPCCLSNHRLSLHLHFHFSLLAPPPLVKKAIPKLNLKMCRSDHHQSFTFIVRQPRGLESTAYRFYHYIRSNTREPQRLLSLPSPPKLPSS
jgi:hypothetical protein